MRLLLDTHAVVVYRRSPAVADGVEHRDPFDRMLAAQSELEALLLVTRDPAFEAFGTKTLC